jgi:hypothetical protein
MADRQWPQLDFGNFLRASENLAQPSCERHAAWGSRAPCLKNLLGDIQPDRAELFRERLPQMAFNASTLAHRCHRSATLTPPGARGFGALLPREGALMN